MNSIEFNDRLISFYYHSLQQKFLLNNFLIYQQFLWYKIMICFLYKAIFSFHFFYNDLLDYNEVQSNNGNQQSYELNLMICLYVYRPLGKLLNPSIDSIQDVSGEDSTLDGEAIHLISRVVFLIIYAAVSHSVCVPQETRNSLLKTAIRCCLAIRSTNTN